MKTNYDLRLSAAAVRANPRVRPSNKGRHAGLPLQFARHGQRRSRVAIWLSLAFTLCFNLLSAQTATPDFIDSRDGQTYKTVIMPDGKRWMAENLRYRNGLNNPVFSNIPASSANTFTASKNLYYCPGPGPLNTSVNQADPLACEYWGALYPFWVAYANSANTAVNTTLGEQGICPTGWHLPTDNEWNLLFTKIGGSTDAGKLLKDTARGTFANNQAWKRYWTNAALQNTNSYGFSALAAGLRTTAGAYSGNGTQALFWTSTPNTNGTQASSKIFTNSSNSPTGSSTQLRADALSVRCVEGTCKEADFVLYSSCENPVGFDTILFINSTVAKTYNFALNPILSTGTWSYTINCEFLPTGVSLISNPYVEGSQVRLAFRGLSNASDGEIFILKIKGTNPNYCSIDTSYVIRFVKDDRFSYYTSADAALAIGTNRLLLDTRDNKTYKIVKMPDNKWWMAENLNYQQGLSFNSRPDKIGGDVTTFTSTQNGIPGIGNFWCPETVFGATTSTLAECEAVGVFYTWECVMSADGIGAWKEGTYRTATTSGNASSFTEPTRGICPVGWHVPSDAEWGMMLNAVEAQFSGTQKHNTTTGWIGSVAGTKLKACFTSGASDDRYGFSVLPAGYRTANGGGIGGRGGTARYWVASCNTADASFVREFQSSYTTVYRMKNYGRSGAFSVRCIMN